MSPQEYNEFTDELRHSLEADQRVIGLVALGSMAQQDYQPDKWSDHDFFVIVETGTQEAFRTDLSWLPSSKQIVFSFRETAHGLKVLYRNGHLLEFAVFDLPELQLARINRYRVLLDRDAVGAQLAEIKASSLVYSNTETNDDKALLGQFMLNLLVGVGRHHRGEKLSGQQFVKQFAFRNLLLLLQKYLPSPTKGILDNLDPSRRFERAYPALGQELNQILSQETPLAAKGLLALAGRELKDYMQDYPAEAAAVIEQQFE